MKNKSVNNYVTIITLYINKTYNDLKRSILEQTISNWIWLVIIDDKEKFSILTKENNDKRINFIYLKKINNTSFKFLLNNITSNAILLLDYSTIFLEKTTFEKYLLKMIFNPQAKTFKSYNIFEDKKNIQEIKFNFKEINSILLNKYISYTLFFETNFFKKLFLDSNISFTEFFNDSIQKILIEKYSISVIEDYLETIHLTKECKYNYSNFKNYKYTFEQNPYNSFKKCLPKKLFNINKNNYKNSLLLIVPWLEIGGADLFNINLLKELVKFNWNITIITTLKSSNPWYNEFLKITKDIFILPNLGPQQVSLSIINHIINSRKINIVMVSNSMLGYHCVPYLKTHFPKLIFVDYNHMEEEYWENGGHAFTSVIFQDYFDKNFVASKHLKNWMITKGAKKSKIDVCYIGVEEKNLNLTINLPERINSFLNKDNYPTILFAGRFVEQKQPNVLIKVIDKVLKNTKKFKVIMCGDGPMYNDMITMVKELEIDDKILLTGALDNNCIRHIMQHSDIFFLPSKWEGIALSIYEAMLLNMAILGANVGGQKELVTEKCGKLIELNSIEEQIDTYTKFLTNWLNNNKKLNYLKTNASNTIKNKFLVTYMGQHMNTELLNLVKKGTIIKKSDLNPITSYMFTYRTTTLLHKNGLV